MDDFLVSIAIIIAEYDSRLDTAVPTDYTFRQVLEYAIPQNVRNAIATVIEGQL